MPLFTGLYARMVQVGVTAGLFACVALSSPVWAHSHSHSHHHHHEHGHKHGHEHGHSHERGHSHEHGQSHEQECCATPPQECDQNDPDRLGRQLETKLWLAIQDHQDAELAKLLSHQFLGLYNNGRITDYCTQLEAFRHEGLIVFDIHDLHARLSVKDGKVLAVAYRINLDRLIGGQIVHTNALRLDTWKKEGDEWKLFSRANYIRP